MLKRARVSKIPITRSGQSGQVGNPHSVAEFTGTLDTMLPSLSWRWWAAGAWTCDWLPPGWIFRPNHQNIMMNFRTRAVFVARHSQKNPSAHHSVTMIALELMLMMCQSDPTPRTSSSLLSISFHELQKFNTLNCSLWETLQTSSKYQRPRPASTNGIQQTSQSNR